MGPAKVIVADPITSSHAIQGSGDLNDNNLFLILILLSAVRPVKQRPPDPFVQLIGGDHLAGPLAGSDGNVNAYARFRREER